MSLDIDPKALTTFSPAVVDESDENLVNFPQFADSLLPPPLPYEIPAPPDLSRLPKAVIHTGTVEMLLNQNEDLMARLKVTLRRNASLDAKFLEMETEQKNLKSIRESLEAQVHVLREKDRINQERRNCEASSMDALEEKILFLKTQNEAFETANSQMRSELQAQSRFRARIKKWLKPSLSQLKHRLIKLQEIISAQNERLLSRDAEVRTLKSQISLQDTAHEERLKAQIQDQNKIVDRYESKISKLQNEMHALQDKAIRFDELIRSETLTKNRLIYFERRCDELEERLRTEYHDLRVELSQHREEAKFLAAEKVRLESGLSKLDSELKVKADALSELASENESLRSVVRSLNPNTSAIPVDFKLERLESNKLSPGPFIESSDKPGPIGEP